MLMRLGLLCLVVLTGYVAASDETPKPPVAAVKSHATPLHGETLTDQYFWLREKKDPEVIKHLEAENAYTEAITKPTVRLRDKLYKEMLGRIKQTDLTVPSRATATGTTRAPRRASSTPSSAAARAA